MSAYAAHSSNEYLSKAKRACNRFQLLCHVPFLLICVSLLTSHLGISMIYVHLTNYSISKGSTDIQASLLTSVIGITGSLGRLFVGLMGNVAEISNMVLYFGTYGIVGIATVLLQLYVTTYTGQMIYSIVFGTYCGCCYVLLNTITPELLGIDNLASAFGFEMFFAGAGSLIGVVLAGVVVDSGGTYETAFTMAGVSILVAAVLVLAADAFRNVSNPRQKITTREEEALNADGTNYTSELDVPSVLPTRPCR
ncbi:monocarboxylate transporter 9-like [Pecten maximus]|uniref:monocarboxylate transporter 9-like n=1 Tax=Pecten maximus TaxID=6579 RepID=UPI0014583F57|nr:monocarboxylate transporter 9-like [Pecten maximus]XP_033731798.1 monocarboxylate transporter 9-like [Pecten maximus]